MMVTKLNWPTKRLSTVAEFRNGVNYNKNSFGKGVKVVGVSNFQDYFKPKYAELDEINPEGVVTERNILRDGDIVFVRSNGNRELIGRSLYIEKPPEPVTHSAFTIRLRFKSPDIYPKFYAYYFRTPLIRQAMTAQGGGTNISNLNQDILNALEVPFLPFHVQYRIASILSAYDELIENSRQRIKTLEQMARAFYREWFTQFRFPGHENHPRVTSALGEIPEGWEVKFVKDIANVTYGFPFQSKQFRTDGNGTPVIRIRDILAGVSSTFTDEKAESKYHIRDGHILIGMDGDFHMSIWSSGHAYQNQRVARFESKGEIGNFHLFLALEQPIQALNKAIVGTTVAHLGDMHIKKIQLVWPPDDIRSKALKFLEPLSEQIIILKQRAANLQRTRDLLLPRLLSGQIDLGVAEEEGRVQGVAPSAPEEVSLCLSTSIKAEVAARETAIELQDARRPIDSVEREEVICTIRKVFGDGVERDRDVALRDIAYALGYQRLGPRIRDALSRDLIAALRRGIIVNEGGNYRLGFRSFADCPRDALKDAFESAIGRTWIVRKDAIRAFARWAGFGRVGDVIDQTARSLINGLIREGRVETDGPELIRRT